jgi:hypothetical protein
VRLLLGREFHLEDVLRLWDAIFAYGQGLALVDYIIVAMLVYIRESRTCCCLPSLSLSRFCHWSSP